MASKPAIRFRNYKPQDAALADGTLGVTVPAPPAPSVVVAAEEAQELARLVAAEVRRTTVKRGSASPWTGAR